MPPCSSGGVAIGEILNVLSEWEQSQARRIESLGHNSADYVHLVVEVMKHAFADRAEFLGDADFAEVPVARLTSREYAGRIAKRIDMATTKGVEDYGRAMPVNDAGTSHISVIDRHGNAVACTETINTFFGSYVVEPEFGIVLNNEMDDFSTAKGRPNAFRLIQSTANVVAPGKKPLSSMSPTIVLENGRAIQAVGGSGGPRIISATLQVLLNQLRFGMTSCEAVHAPRFHHQWLPHTVFLEPDLYERLRDPLAERGHRVESQKILGVVQTAGRTPHGLLGASDPRKYGRPAGF